MYKIDWKKEWPFLVAIAALIIVSAILYPRFPEMMPSHWNAAGQIDAYMPKLQNVLFLNGLCIFLYALLLVTPFLDPKKESYELFADTYRSIRLLLTFFFVGIAALVYATSLRVLVNVGDIITIGVSILIIVLGNTFGKLPQNYFVGVKLPWTLADEQNWNKTHRFAGKVTVIAGICMILSIFMPMFLRFSVFFGAIIAIVFIPAIYSYRMSITEKK